MLENSGQSSELDVTDIQVTAAKLNGQAYFWRVVLDGGRVIDQFDPVTGKEQQFPNWVTWVTKSPLDPYPSTPAFLGVREAAWIPTVDGADAFLVTKEEGAHSVIIYRKNYVRQEGGKYCVYVVGQRWENDNCREAVYHICPPVRYTVGYGGCEQAFMFDGDVTLLTKPLQDNAFDTFLKKVAKQTSGPADPK